MHLDDMITRLLMYSLCSSHPFFSLHPVSTFSYYKHDRRVGVGTHACTKNEFFILQVHTQDNEYKFCSPLSVEQRPEEVSTARGCAMRLSNTSLCFGVFMSALGTICRVSYLNISQRG